MTTQIAPATNCDQHDMVSFVLSFPGKYAKTNLKRDSRIQKIEANWTAPCLVEISFCTAYVGIQLLMVDYSPTRTNRPILISSSNLTEPALELSCNYCYSADFTIFSGEVRKKKMGMISRQAAAITQNTFCSKNPTKIGPPSDPNPYAPCEKDIHRPISFLGGAIIRQIFVPTTQIQLNNLMMEMMMIWVFLVFMKVKTTLKIAISKQQTMSVVWKLGKRRYLPKILQIIAAVKVATEIQMNMTEYSVSSMPSYYAIKGISGPTELKGRAVMKRLNMQRAR